MTAKRAVGRVVIVTSAVDCVFIGLLNQYRSIFVRFAHGPETAEEKYAGVLVRFAQMYTPRVCTFSAGMNGNPLGGTLFNHVPFQAGRIRACEEIQSKFERLKPRELDSRKPI